MATAPTVYFIDDSATMREVIKIAFRRENINVVACHDAASAIAMMDQTVPDVVISGRERDLRVSPCGGGEGGTSVARALHA